MTSVGWNYVLGWRSIRLMESIGVRDRDDVFEVAAFLAVYIVLEADQENIQTIPST